MRPIWVRAALGARNASVKPTMKTHKDHPRVITTLFFALSILTALLFVASAYGGWVHPSKWAWTVSLTLFFPFFLLANLACMTVWLVACSRRWIVNMLALAVCVPSIRTYIPINIPEPVPKGSVKVISYNTFGMGNAGADTTSFRQMLQFLRTCNADILCLQEAAYPVKYKKEVEQATSRWSYRDTLLLPGQCVAQLAFYSTYPILNRVVVASPSSTHFCVVYRLKIQKDTVVVVNNHFVTNSMNNTDKEAYTRLVNVEDQDSTYEDVLRLMRKINRAGVKRAVQVDSLIACLDTLGDKPTIVCGDFNDSPLSYVHTALTRRLNDAYTRTGNGPGISYHETLMYFRLDNILYSRHFKPFAARVMKEMKMSDHYPIEAWLKRVN